MDEQQYEAFRLFLFEKENIGILRITAIGLVACLLAPVRNPRKCITFAISAGYYRRLILPEIQHIKPVRVLAYREGYTATENLSDLSDLPPDEQIRVKVYF